MRNWQLRLSIHTYIFKKCLKHSCHFYDGKLYNVRAARDLIQGRFQKRSKEDTVSCDSVQVVALRIRIVQG